MRPSLFDDDLFGLTDGGISDEEDDEDDDEEGEDVPSPTNDEDLLSINHMDFTTEDSAGPSTQRHRRSSISTRL